VARGLILALLFGLATASPAAAAGWHRVYEKADSSIVAYGVEAEGDSLNSALLVCRCRHGELELHVITDRLGPGPADVVHLREVVTTLDSAPPYRETWSIVPHPDGGMVHPKPRAFATTLLHARRLWLRLEGSRPLEFAVRGFEEPLRTLVAACPERRPEPPAGTTPGSTANESTQVDELPEAISKVAPIYPPEARAQRVTGTVVVQAYVDEDGKVIDTKVVKSIPLLDAAAVASIRQWKFKPARTDGHPVRVWLAIPIKFSLQ
jgi:protein TonB